MTSGIDVLGLSQVGRIFAAVAAFNDFHEGNDPHGEHDCASQIIDGHRIIWKIDYYDRSMTYASPDASDPAVTSRVLTIMLAEEY